MERSQQNSAVTPRGARRGTIGIWSALAFGGSLVALNAMITAYRWIPAGQPVLALVPAVETAVTVMIAVAVALVGMTPGRVVSILWSCVLGIYMVFSGVEALYQHFFQRHFTPWTDVPFVKGGLLLLFGPMDRLLGPAMVATIVIVLGVATAFSWLCFRGLTWGGRHVQGRLLMSVLALMMLAGAAFSTRPGDWLTVGIARSGRRPSVDVMTRNLDAEETPAASTDAGTGSGPPALARPDLHLFFVESYGRTAFSRPELSRELEPLLLDLEHELNEAGYSTVSGFLSSPVTGGYSWIAEAAFLTGAPISNQADYEAAIANGGVPTLPGIMADDGYFTLLSMPGTIHGDWPEATSFYHFEEVMLTPEFDYAGPSFSFVPIPDQVALAQVYQRLTDARSAGLSRPAYIQHVLVSSHAPYNRIPPYIEDWEKLGNGSLYFGLPIASFDNDWFGGRQYDEGYISALSYSLTVIARFLTLIVREDVVAVLIGDHQPGPPVRRRDAPKSVPIHIVAKEANITSALADYGYVSGMIPDQALPHEPSYTFLDLFLPIVRGLSPHDESQTAPE